MKAVEISVEVVKPSNKVVAFVQGLLDRMQETRAQLHVRVIGDEKERKQGVMVKAQAGTMGEIGPDVVTNLVVLVEKEVVVVIGGEKRKEGETLS